MPRNYFGSDPFETGTRAFDNAFDRTQAIGDQITTNKAGRQLAGGDRRAAAATFAGGGMIDPSRQLTGDQDKADASERGEMDEQQKAAAEARLQVLKGVGAKLRTAPLGQRLPLLQRALPLFEQTQYAPEAIEALRNMQEADLTDEGIDSVVGEAEKEWKFISTSAGLARVNERKGTHEIVAKPERKAPTGFIYDEDGNLEVDPGFVKGKGAIAAATRAPPRARSGGGRAGGRPKSYSQDEVKW